MDLTETTAPRSDQQNFDDYVTGPKTVTISEVKRGSVEQPADFCLEEFPGRPYKPSKSMRRVIVAAWGPDTSIYSGRKLRLYGDPSVRFGGSVVGGIKISNMSHIDAPVTTMLTESKGRRAPFTVQPLTEDPSVALNAAKKRVAAAAPAGVDLKTWVPDQLKRLELDGATTANLNKLAEDLEAGT